MEKSKFTLSTPAAIVIAGILISGTIMFTGLKQSEQINAPVAKDIVMKKISKSDHIRENLDAPIVIVEYSDTECPFCKIFHITMKTLLNDYQGKVSWVYRHFPIDSLHPKAHKEAQALECAGDLGGEESFWKYTDRLYEITESNNRLDPAELPKIAEYVGLEKEKFNECLESEKFKDLVDAQIKDAMSAGASGTPYSVIVTKDGKQIPINGAQPIDTIKNTIDILLDQ